MSTTPHLDHDLSLSKIDNADCTEHHPLQKIQALIDRSNDIYFIVTSAEKRFTYINGAVAEMLGFSADEAMALSPNAFMTAASMDAICDAIPRAIAAHSKNDSAVAVPSLHIQLIAKDRKRIPAEIRLSLSLTEHHTVEAITGVVRSETPRQNERIGSAVSGKSIDVLFNALPSGCIICVPSTEGEDFIIQACNTAAERLEGISGSACIGKRLSEMLPDLKKNDVFALMLSVAQSGIAVRIPVTFYATGKSEGWREYYICRIAGNRIMMLFSDETGRKRQTALSTELVESFGVLAGGIAHDFNNVAGLIFGQIDMVLGSLDPQSGEAQRLQQSMRAFDRMRDLTGQLSALSKKNTPVKKRTDIRELLHSAAVMVLRGSGIEFSISAADGPVEIEADADLLNHAFSHLFENALAATGNQGRITIEIRRAAAETIPKMLLPGSYVQVDISDNGCGIPKECLGVLYKPSFSNNEKKRGIGLAVVRSIISRHGGTISIESVVDKGTTVSLLLPVGCLDTQAVTSAAVLSSPTAPGRVLVMDDEEILLDIAAQMCRRLGLEVDTAVNSIEAVEKYREEFRQGRPYDLVLLDMTIPGGSGGLETVATLREIDPEIKAVAMSGYADHEVLADPSKYGFTATLTKPFRLNEFGAVLKSVLPPEKFRTRQ